MKTDQDFDSVIIKSFRKSDSGYELTFNNGWSFFMPEAGFAPEVGQTAKLYPKGIGCQVRGLVVNERVVFYRTKSELSGALWNVLFMVLWGWVMLLASSKTAVFFASN